MARGKRNGTKRDGWTKVRPIRHLPQGTEKMDGVKVKGKIGEYLTNKHLTTKDGTVNIPACEFYGVSPDDAVPFRLTDLDPVYQTGSATEMLAKYAAGRKRDVNDVLMMLVLDQIGRDMYARAIKDLRPATETAINDAFATIRKAFPQYANLSDAEIIAKMATK